MDWTRSARACCSGNASSTTWVMFSIRRIRWFAKCQRRCFVFRELSLPTPPRHSESHFVILGFRLTIFLRDAFQQNPSEKNTMDLSRDLERIDHQESELIFTKFDLEIAWQLGLRLRQLATDRRLPVAIDVRYFGQPLFYSALPGSVPDNAEWVRRKSNTVARF